jgi:hypothetical protein
MAGIRVIGFPTNVINFASSSEAEAAYRSLLKLRQWVAHIPAITNLVHFV